jgi:plasmid stability protein
MFIRMRTTVRLDDGLMREARVYAAEHGRTLTSLVEEGIRTVLQRQRAGRTSAVDLPVSKGQGGTLPGVDLDDTSSLLEVMDGRE